MLSSEVLPEVAQVRQASREMVRELGLLNGQLDRFGINNSQCHTMIELEHHGVLTAAEVADRLNLDRSTMSRSIKQLMDAGFVALSQSEEDRRKKPLCLTSKGKKKLARIHDWADQRVNDALELMSPDERRQVAEGLSAYTSALRKRRRQTEFSIRLIDRRDDPQVARLIRTVMPEFGADGPGFAIHDPEVTSMYASYTKEGGAYFVLCDGHERGAAIIGGGGFGALVGGPKDVCELRKMYFLPKVRGLGLGRRLLEHVLQEAKAAGYKRCYLETIEAMVKARRLYLSAGFKALDKPLGATGHFGCDRWMIKTL